MGALAAFWLHYYWTVGGSNWLAMPFGNDSFRPEAWVQINNLAYLLSTTLADNSSFLKSPELIVHHAVTLFGCVSLLHPAHSLGYGTLFTSVTEFGSFFHNVMIIWNNTPNRWLRVFTDLTTRGFGLYLIHMVGSQPGLPMFLKVWAYFGGGFWFLLNANWTMHVARGLLRGRPQKSKKSE
jgi:hypothetical protein